MTTARAAIAAVAAIIAVSGRLAAQQAFGVTPMAQGIFTLDRSDPIPGGGSLSEARLVQPVLMATGHLFGRQLGFVTTLDLEGLTIKNGELAPGDWGEGFVDRRHPHTYAHELMLQLTDPLGRLDGKGRLGLALGKGFVPFGSDDPMSRPFVRYPVNHHLSQLLERAVGIVQYDLGPATVEGALFNGDEPTSASDWPLIRTDQGTWRFGDSRAVRLTVRPVRGFEVEGSLAHVHSPENRPGGGPDAEKQAVSARWDDVTPRGERYALVEYSRSSELAGTFVYHSVLAEGMLTRGRWRLSYRFERTERPEELRTVDPFRTVRPAADNSILGVSRWTLNTVHVAVDALSPMGRLEVEPFIEGTLGSVAAVGAGIFDPVALYGTDQVRALSIGVALGWGMRGHRMGRYGVLAGEGMAAMPGMTM